MGKKIECDYVIIGAGIIGLSIVSSILKRKPNASIVILEKEGSLAFHASGRNSGVIHAGFYYTPDSLKAKFTKDGNQALKRFCRANGIPVNACGKVVVAQNKEELNTLLELERRGKKNQVDVQLISEKELKQIESNAKTFKHALYSPSTATVDPIQVVQKMHDQIQRQNRKKKVLFFLGEAYKKRTGSHQIQTSLDRTITAKTIINCAGLYADKVARDFSLSKKYKILPFKGLYLKYTLPTPPIQTNIYPVPNIQNPFLGVHFTLTSNGQVKIGPTAIPAFWRENYSGIDRFKFTEFTEIFKAETKLFLMNSFGFRKLALEEVKKYSKKRLVTLASHLVKKIDPAGFTEWSKPGIRAQLMDIKTSKLIQDFVVEENHESVHVLNAVSPAFTCSIPFADWVVDQYIMKK